MLLLSKFVLRRACFDGAFEPGIPAKQASTGRRENVPGLLLQN
jgi:hypothetical protein